jgi:hypothetical protein
VPAKVLSWLWIPGSAARPRDDSAKLVRAIPDRLRSPRMTFLRF